MDREPSSSGTNGVNSIIITTDWARTPLGVVEEWSPTLRATVDLMLRSKFAMTLLWGPSFTLVYNDAYVDLIGDKHPAIGLPAAEVFDEAWEQIGPLMESVATTGEALLIEDAKVPLRRHGFLEDCYFTFSYSAVTAPDGTVEGVIDVVTETTASVLGRRRTEMLARLSDALSVTDSIETVRRSAVDVLRRFDDDFASVQVRLAELDPDHPEPPNDDRTLTATIDAHADDRTDSLLVVVAAPGAAVDDDLRATVRVAAVVIGRALGRVRALLDARARHERERAFSVTLQHALLTHPADVGNAELAVRYVPATHEAEVGGDWYDAFVLPQRGLALVIGDVMGHDRDSAAGMAQMRNVLRGVSMTLRGGPSDVLSGLDAAVDRLAMGVLATALVAHVETHDDCSFTVTWSSAGHPPPALLHPDGSADIVDGPTDPLLGIGTFPRHDRQVTVPRGTTVVLYTDGLVERRERSMDDGYTWLTDALAGHHAATPEEVCDLLIDQMMPGTDDDVALLVLKT